MSEKNNFYYNKGYSELGNKILNEGADIFSKKYLGMEGKKFINDYKKINPKDKVNVMDYIGYLYGLSVLDENWEKVDNLVENGKFQEFYNFLQDSMLGVRVRNSLSRFPNHRTLTTLLSKEVYHKMLNENIDGTIFTGKKYNDIKLNSTFDILLGNGDISELPKINTEQTPAVPYFSPSTIPNPQEYFLSLNKQFPYINKFFLGVQGQKPRLFRLVDSTVGESDAKTKMFAPGSYTILD